MELDVCYHVKKEYDIEKSCQNALKAGLQFLKARGKKDSG